MKILPTLLYPDFEQLKARFEECVTLGGEVHIDFADGEFVPNLLPSIDKIVSLPGDLQIEAHFMVQRPESWIESALQDDRFEMLIIHAEAAVNVPAMAALVRQSGKKIGLALKPATTVEAVADFLPLVDQVLVLMVDPGFNGSPFQPHMVEKISQLRQLYPQLVIEADGGMNPDNLPVVKQAGANRAAVGSFLHDKELKAGLGELESMLAEVN